MRTALTLYCAGPTHEAPWSDAQLWAELDRYPAPFDEHWEAWSAILRPVYGHAAALYRVHMVRAESPEPGWVSARVQLEVSGCTMAAGHWLPISWYIGSPTDWPSGLARFPEGYPKPNPTKPGGTPAIDRQVWTLAVRRSS